MRSFNRLWIAAVMILVCFSSCMQEDDVVLSTDCYISSMNVGMVKRTATTVSSTGEDSTYVYSYNASSFLMGIDQLSGTIQNKDSLPYGSQVDAVTVELEASGTVYYRYADEQEVNWLSYSASDSIDFTHPVVFRVYAVDAASLRDYNVRLNVHQVDGDVFSWRKTDEVPLWDGSGEMKLIEHRGVRYLYAATADGVQLFTASSEGDVCWTAQQLENADGADVATLQLADGVFYMSTAVGDVLRSEDGKLWKMQSAGAAATLFASDASMLYALKDGGIRSSRDGMLWEAVELDAVSENLPSLSNASVWYTQTNGTPRLLTIGSRDRNIFPQDTAAVVWSQSVLNPGRWIYYPVSQDNRYLCPCMDVYNLLWYHDALLAVGLVNDETTGTSALKMLVSRDNGVTWKADKVYGLPKELSSGEKSVACTVDANDVLWMIVGQQVWRGKLNKLDFMEQN